MLKSSLIDNLIANKHGGCIREVPVFLLVSMKALDWFYYLTKFERKMLKTRRVI